MKKYILLAAVLLPFSTLADDTIKSRTITAVGSTVDDVTMKIESKARELNAENFRIVYLGGNNFLYGSAIIE